MKITPKDPTEKVEDNLEVKFVVYLTQ